MYYGAYEGYIDGDNKLRSISNKTAIRYRSFTTFHTLCHRNGSRYGIESFSKRWYICGLLMLICKGRDIKSCIGYSNGGTDSSGDGYLDTGLLNNNGIFYGRGSTSNSGNIYSVKCFGIENFWGNIYKFMDGLCTLSTTTLGFKGIAPYNDSGSGYTSITDGYTRGSRLYITDYIPVLNGAGMIATSGQSDYTKSFCDYWNIKSSSDCMICATGGRWYNYWHNVGPFHCVLFMNCSTQSDYFGARIVYA